jgi:hypothetical protein
MWIKSTAVRVPRDVEERTSFAPFTAAEPIFSFAFELYRGERKKKEIYFQSISSSMGTSVAIYPEAIRLQSKTVD